MHNVVTLPIPLIRTSAWQPAESYPFPQPLRPWLLEPCSLTQRLRRHHQHFSLTWLGNQTVDFSCEEQQLVASTSTQGVCRTVILHGDHGPAILAWTLFTNSVLMQNASTVSAAQPIGDRLFAAEFVPRDHLQLANFEILSNPYCRAATVWGRRSRLFLDGSPLLIHELFLPDLLCHN
ncbi:chorismate--pyruvate lyase family protein [Serratia microhaemolytica]|uniref:chorismate--pyruvate lyase family protein n=1 Tax=Serratia microhaemolytica TaxID=2675110 RepID=UPI000FDD02FC|nr:chorismate lyase [Serratia microhaemolytica]